MTSLESQPADGAQRGGYRRWFRRFLAAFGLCAAAVLSLAALRGESPALIVSDGKLYYAWARSLVVDGDLDFENDYRLLSPPDPLPAELTRARTARGLVVNKYPVGLAALELPATAFAHLVASATGAWPADGASLPYQVAVAGTLLLFSLAGLLLLFEACVRLGARERWAFWVVAGSVAATNAVHYLAKEPAMSHAAGLGLFGIFAWLVARSPGESPRPAALAAAGGAVGLMLLVRNTNILLAPSILWILSTRSSLGLRRAWPFAAAAGSVALLHPLSIFSLWGTLRLTGYADEGFTSGLHGVWSTLFSARHGLFVYHPWYLVLILVNLVGLARRESRMAAAAALGSFALLGIANGTWWCWWFGRGFGNRSFIEALGPLALGAALSLSTLAGGARTRPTAATAFLVVAALSALNANLWIGYLLHRYPDDGLHTVGAAYLWALRR